MLEDDPDIFLADYAERCAIGITADMIEIVINTKFVSVRVVSLVTSLNLSAILENP